ncbi:MAG: TerB family tellurite resistance protein [Alphaproteobacteria bacterium]
MSGYKGASGGVSDSAFYMWRALFALAHADEVVTDEEVRFMAEALEDVPFSDAQRAQLELDAKNPQDIEAMFLNITDVKDQAAFFKFAHTLVHIDGDYGPEEQAAMLKLKELHVKLANIDELIGSMKMEFEEEEHAPPFPPVSARPRFRDRLLSIRKAFLDDFED